MRRHARPLYGTEYCGNKDKKEVHDLDNEKCPCRIDEIIAAGRAVPFNTLKDAHNQKYNNCAYCIVGPVAT